MLHEQAGHDLRALCQGVIHDDDAARRIARFDTTRDPGGALAFACLLLLADYEEGAQFWLEYAAGGGQATSAVCLHLLHLHRGDMRDARYWAEQITALESEPWQCAPVAHQVVDTTVPGPAGMAVYLDLPDIAAAVPEEAVKDAVDDLTVATLDGFGAIPQPPSAARAGVRGNSGAAVPGRCRPTSVRLLQDARLRVGLRLRGAARVGVSR
ncbi:hypothetical protein ABZ589_32820 [Streptomyces sp. NPDC013313]|uniref:hypothetical protein n=1 Tax=Streptomyces sp. NPDC013313 TaxID=3155603 RepID=UPI0033D5AEA1